VTADQVNFEQIKYGINLQANEFMSIITPTYCLRLFIKIICEKPLRLHFSSFCIFQINLFMKM